uniref:Ras-related protein Rab-18-B-like n=2 Tax=Sinocyclocheilus TaxID=75365 RepID=A0A671QPW2_9TELE
MTEDILTTLKILIIGESGVGKSRCRFQGENPGCGWEQSKACNLGHSRSGTFSNFNTQLLQRSSGCHSG